MSIRRLIPGDLKRGLRKGVNTIAQLYSRLTYKPKSRGELHEYWRAPSHAGNRPEEYLTPLARSRFLTDLVQKYLGTDARILEIGCNVGRNLNHLYKAGYLDLSAIEISAEALAMLRVSFPEVAQNGKLLNAPVEQVIRDFKNEEFDLVFSMAVLEHIHSDSEWVFPEMARIAKQYLITIEDETARNWRQFPRNYQKVFERTGMKEIESIHCGEAEGLNDCFYARVFRRA